MITRFEDFPNEILFEIFDYLDIRHVYGGFWQLNCRLNHLLSSLKNLSLIVEKQDSILIALLARRIRRLIITTTENIDLSNMSNLSSLTLHRTTDAQMEQIRSDFMPNLVHLSLAIPFHFSLPYQLVRDLFSNEFSSLRHLMLGRLDGLYRCAWSQSPSLHSVQIACTDPNTIPLILAACPNLQNFRVKFFGHNRHILPPTSANYDHSLREFFLEDPYYALSFDTIDILLCYIPHIEWLYLQFFCRISFHRLVESLSNRLDCLRRFECDILELAHVNEFVNVEIIRKSHSALEHIQCTVQEDGSRMFTMD